jgi:hypothetical protein
MGQFYGVTASSGARIKEGKEAEVLKLIDKYDYYPDLLCEIYDGRIGIWGEEWPRFWLKEKSKKNVLGDTTDVFEEFLEELAPLLAEDLVIHAIGHEKCEWPMITMELRVTHHGVMNGGGFKWFK